MNRFLVIGWAKIASGNAASGLLRLLGLAIAAHSLDVTSLGIIVLIEAYVRVVDGLLNFQSVNVMTKFLAEVDYRQNPDRFRGLIKAGILVDGATAFGTCVLAIAFLPLLGGWSGIPDEWIALGMLFCVVILSRILGTPEAVLRCFDRFWAIGLRETAGAAILVMASIAAWWMNAGAIVFLLIWIIAEAIANIVFLVWTFIVLKHYGIGHIASSRAREAIRASPGFWKVLWQTNLTFGIRTLSQYGDLLVAGAVLGPAATSLLRAVKSIATILSQFGRPLQQVASAPITRMWAEKESRALFVYTRNICAVSALVGLGVVMLSALYGDLALRLLFGPEFMEAEMALVILMLANAVYLAGVTLLPTTVALGQSEQFLYGIILGTTVYAVALGVGVVPFGIVGIAVSHLAFNVVWAAYCWHRVYKQLKLHFTAGLSAA